MPGAPPITHTGPQQVVRVPGNADLTQADGFRDLLHWNRRRQETARNARTHRVGRQTEMVRHLPE
jgi:hypothetical protein